MKNRLAVSLAVLVLAVSASMVHPQSQGSDLDRKVEEIRETLAKLPYYGVFDHLGFQFDQKSGKLTLVGSVVRPSLKNDAERVVGDIEWVKDINNQIEVLPLSGADDRIRRALYQAIYSSPSLQKYQTGADPSIHIIVKNGNVRLEGVVLNEGDKTIAGAEARSVGGTFAVKNNLQIEQQAKNEKAE